VTHVTSAALRSSIWAYLSPTLADTWIKPLVALLDDAGIDLRLIPSSTLAPTASSLTLLLREAVPPSAVLCLTERHDAALAAINRVCCAAHVPLLLADPRNGAQAIGPGVIFGVTPCLECLASHEQFFALVPTGAGIADSAFVERLAQELLAFTRHPNSSLLRQGYMLWPSPTVGTLSPCRILKDPACAVCSIAGRYPTEIVHTNQYKVEHAY
jgi:hypothetical protein